MTKRKGKKCEQCELFKHIKDGAGFCKFGAGEQCLNFAGNSACKMYVPEQPKPKKEVLEPGKAPFCGDFPKCNNAEGCDSCREFEIWAAEKEQRKATELYSTADTRTGPACANSSPWK
ncbi:MAG: hypothetical protein IKA93_00610 [Elusimicrobiaceae bacterium]|nr:hypothetical protein [Elusimicrobiaceae bacterium]